MKVIMGAMVDRLKELRRVKGVTQKDAADYMGISERNYRRYEISDINPTASNLMKLADYYGVTTDYLLGRTEYQQDIDVNTKK